MSSYFLSIISFHFVATTEASSTVPSTKIPITEPPTTQSEGAVMFETKSDKESDPGLLLMLCFALIIFVLVLTLVVVIFLCRNKRKNHGKRSGAKAPLPSPSSSSAQSCSDMEKAESEERLLRGHKQPMENSQITRMPVESEEHFDSACKRYSLLLFC